VNPPHGFRLIVFDVDGTLVDSQHAIMLVMTTAFAAEGLPAPELAALRRQVGLGIEETMARLLPEAEEALHRRLSQGFREAAHELRSTAGFAEPLYPGIREACTSSATPSVPGDRHRQGPPRSGFYPVDPWPDGAVP